MFWGPSNFMAGLLAKVGLICEDDLLAFGQGCLDSSIQGRKALFLFLRCSCEVRIAFLDDLEFDFLVTEMFSELIARETQTWLFLVDQGHPGWQTKPSIRLEMRPR